MTVGDICNRNVVVAPKGEMIIDAAKRMRTSHGGALVVVETRNGRHVPVGIITDRDIVISVVAGDPQHMHSLLVGDVMGTDLITARLQYGWSTIAFFNALVQYKTDAREWSSNLRFNIIHRPLSDFFLVLNDRRDSDTGDLIDHAVVAKMTYMVAF